MNGRVREREKEKEKEKEREREGERERERETFASLSASSFPVYRARAKGNSLSQQLAGREREKERESEFARTFLLHSKPSKDVGERERTRSVVPRAIEAQAGKKGPPRQLLVPLLGVKKRKLLMLQPQQRPNER